MAGAFYTLSKSRFQTQWSLWERELPGIKPFYAVKCNPEPNLLEWHAKAGGAFDCASAREMTMVKPYIGQKESILFANPCKTPQDISVARKMGVPWVTADSVEEIFKMYMAIYRPNVLVRIAVDDTSAACPFSAKFGIEPALVENVLKEARQHAIHVSGLSFHVGSGSKNPEAFGEAIHLATDVWKTLQLKGYVERLETLDIGGGWSFREDLFEKQAASVKRALLNLPENLKPETVIAEPGRFFAAPTHTLYVRVMGKKPALNGRGFRYTLDESIYGQFSCIPFDHAKPTFFRLKTQNEFGRRHVPATFFGRTCDSLDWIANSTSTEELFVGDWLVIPNMGAYTTATSTEFNGFPRPTLLETDDEPDNETCLSPLSNLSFPLADKLSL